MSYWEKLKTNKQIYTYIYIQKLDKTHTLYIDSANPTWADSFPVFYLNFEVCQICNVFLSCGMEFQILSPKYDIDCLPYVSVSTWLTLKNFFWLMSKIIMI